MTQSPKTSRRLGYARVSTVGQTLDAQLEQLKADGCTRIYREKASDARPDRRQLLRLLADTQVGDVVTVTRIDRLARSTFDLFAIVAFARLRPSAVRVRIRSRSTSAKPPRTAIISRPVLVAVSAHGSARDRNWPPASTMRLKARRSRSWHEATTSPPRFGPALPGLVLLLRGQLGRSPHVLPAYNFTAKSPSEIMCFSDRAFSSSSGSRPSAGKQARCGSGTPSPWPVGGSG
jgi:hypothetical protein